MGYYHTCPYCGAHLDPGERCDCLLHGESPVFHGTEDKRGRNGKEADKKADRRAVTK